MSAIASAVAALASWAAVAQASRWQRRQRQPELSIEVSQNMNSGVVRVRIDNSGGGLAKGVNFWVLEGDAICMGGVPPHATLKAGSGVTLQTPLRSEENKLVHGVVICRAGRFMHAWSAAGIHKKWALQLGPFDLRAPSYAGMVRHFYPDIGDPTAFPMLRYELVEHHSD